MITIKRIDFKLVRLIHLILRAISHYYHVQPSIQIVT